MPRWPQNSAWQQVGEMGDSKRVSSLFVWKVVNRWWLPNCGYPSDKNGHVEVEGGESDIHLCCIEKHVMKCMLVVVFITALISGMAIGHLDTLTIFWSIIHHLKHRVQFPVGHCNISGKTHCSEHACNWLNNVNHITWRTFSHASHWNCSVSPWWSQQIDGP